AYAVQTINVPLRIGRQANPFVLSVLGWLNNATLGIARPLVVDGGSAIKPSGQAIWATQIVSTFDLIATKDALGTMFAAINPKMGGAR
ncbi:glycoside hydrolase family 78 protein, partial [Sphaerobolus stellatus SS14]